MTISTFYIPDSNNDSGVKCYEGNSQTWTFCRDHTGLHATDNGDAHSELTVFIGWNVNGPGNEYWDRMHRSILIFDTSSIPDGDDMHEATLNVWFKESAYNGVIGDASGWSTSQKSIVLTEGDTASDTAVVGTDYARVKGNTKWSAEFLATVDSSANPSVSGAWSDNSYTEIDLNATGLSGVSKTGVTKIAVQSVADVDDDAPSASGANEQMMMAFFALDHPLDNGGVNDLSQAPKLVVRHGLDPFTPKIIMF